MVAGPLESTCCYHPSPRSDLNIPKPDIESPNSDDECVIVHGKLDENGELIPESLLKLGCFDLTPPRVCVGIGMFFFLFISSGLLLVELNGEG